MDSGTNGCMIISRTPFRLPLGGGSTDLPSYYSKYGGFFISAALNKYMYIAVHNRFERGLRIGYSQTEIVNDSDSVKHPLVREALKLVGIKEGIEVISFADVPAATGLGSSGSFTVGLLRALYTHKRKFKRPEEVAEEACDIAINKLNEPSGKQDEYVASLGGIRSYEIDTSGNVKSEELNLSDHVIAELESSILMFYTGMQRSSREVLSKQQEQVKSGDSTVEKMHEIKRIGMESKKVLERGDLKRFGELLHDHWVVKRGVTDNMSTSNIDRWYATARDNGAIGGKVIGAGAGGFLMVFCENYRQQVRSAMAREGLVEYRIRFDFEGSKVVYNS
ncbi:MAG: GHMP family kinase ATP-binding protein [Nitrososphaerales archaeon]